MVFFFLVTDALTDLAMLLLPMRTTFTLQLPLRTKIGVVGIFALGGFVVITSVVRMAVIDHRQDPYENMSSQLTNDWTLLITLQSTSIDQSFGRRFICVPPFGVLVSPYTNHSGHLFQQR
jgi:hypothetical protein